MKRILLLSVSAGMVALIFSSYGSGPFNGGAGNHTGSAGSQANCSFGSGCHATNTSATQVFVTVTTLTGGAVTKYTPGTTYKVTVGGSNTSSQPKFGFQLTCVKSSSQTTQAGSFSSLPSNISVRNTAGVNIVEHNTPITAATAGTYLATFNWTAPAAGTDTVRFYATLNAVNGTGTSASDQPNTLSGPLILPENKATGVISNKPLQLSVYPNPASGALHLKLSSTTTTCSVRIFNLTGSIVSSNDVRVINGESLISTATLPAGNYYLLVQQGNQQFAAAFAKQ